MSARDQKRIVVFGALPPPIGGVTTFLSRLIEANYSRVEIFYDFSGEAGDKASKKVRVISGSRLVRLLKVSLLIIWHGLRRKAFLNVSRISGALLATPAVLFGVRPTIMFHHGDLAEEFVTMPLVVRKIVRFTLGRSRLMLVSEPQYRDIKWLMRANADVVVTKSYIMPRNDLEELPKENTFVTSGVCKRFNRFDLLISAMEDYPDYKLKIFIYGHGESSYIEEISRLARSKDNITIVADSSERDFNDALREAFCYVRVADRDSMGIAVRDALMFKCICIATDVCPRPSQCLLYAPSDLEGLKCQMLKAINMDARSTDLAPDEFEWSLI